MSNTSIQERKKKVLLFYPNRVRKPWPIMPIGLCYVASALSRDGHEVNVVDLVFENNWTKKVTESLIKYKPEIIGISIRNIDNVDWYDTEVYIDDICDSVINPIRKENKDALIVIGGAGVNIMPENLLRHLGADCAVYGDGEDVICRVINMWEPGKEFPYITGVIWNADNEPKYNAIADRITLLDKLEQSSIFKWVDTRPYSRAGTPYPIQTKRGCVFQCSYCVYKAIEGSRYRLRSPEKIADEIALVNQKTGIWHFEFTDSVFNHPPGHAENICREIIKRNLNCSFTTSGVNLFFLTDELLDGMERAGFEDFSLSPDSASDTILSELGKGYTSKDVLIQAAHLILRFKLPVVWWFILGLPQESQSTAAETLAFVRTYVRPSDLALVTVGIRILPGTRIEQIARTEGMLKSGQDLLYPVFYEPKMISLTKIRQQVMNEVKSIPNMILSTETRSFSHFLKVGILTKRIFKLKQPLWRLIPLINRLRRKNWIIF